jgi:hypothetical protein
MGLFDWLDPTRSWPPVPGRAPDLSRHSLQLTSLPFGAPLESARVLGRPDEVEWESRIRKEFSLLYAAKGFRLHFVQGKLVRVTYLVGRGASEHRSFEPAQPMAPDGTRLTGDVDRARIVALFGEPDPGGSDETCLQVFHGRGVISDFDLDERGCLKEWTLYPDD